MLSYLVESGNTTRMNDMLKLPAATIVSTERVSPMLCRLSLAVLALAAVPAAAQNAPSGAVLYAPCKACHTIDKGGRNGLGPNLNGVVGRKAGSLPGFNYSAAMKGFGKTWTPALLDAYLADPRKTVPNNKMIYPGLKDPQKRAALIAWLKAQ